MTKQAWFTHIDGVGLVRPSLGGNRVEYAQQLKAHIASGCAECKARLQTKRASGNARAKHEAYLSAGLVRVRGALGGIYYE